jgi:hypothetical protein
MCERTHNFGPTSFVACSRSTGTLWCVRAASQSTESRSYWISVCRYPVFARTTHPDILLIQTTERTLDKEVLPLFAGNNNIQVDHELMQTQTFVRTERVNGVTIPGVEAKINSSLQDALLHTNQTIRIRLVPGPCTRCHCSVTWSLRSHTQIQMQIEINTMSS